MSENKLKHLFAAARQEPAPVPASEFADDVLRAIRREPPVRVVRAAGLLDDLTRWFPRVAPAAAAIILFCLGADFGLAAWGLPGLGDAATQAACGLWINPLDL